MFEEKIKTVLLIFKQSIGRHPFNNSELSPSNIIINYYYASITSVNVNSLFSHFKNILRPSRWHLTFGQFKKLKIIRYYRKFVYKIIFTLNCIFFYRIHFFSKICYTNHFLQITHFNMYDTYEIFLYFNYIWKIQNPY